MAGARVAVFFYAGGQAQQRLRRYRWPLRRGVRGRILRGSPWISWSRLDFGNSRLVASWATVIYCDRISNTVEEPIRCRISHLRQVLCADSCDTNDRGHSRQAPRRGYISRPAGGLDRHLSPTHLTPTPLISPTQCLSTTQLFLHSVARGTSDTSLPSGCSVRFPGLP